MNQELSNKNLMLTVLRAFKEGDVGPLMAALGPNIMWKSNSPPEYFRFGGQCSGIAEVKARIAQLGGEIQKGGPKAASEFIQAQMALWTKLVKSKNISVE